MHINHIACWTDDLDRMANFYARYFGAEVQPLYTNPAKNYSSRFLVFPGGSRLELMHKPTIQDHAADPHIGFTHIAFSAGSQEAVDQLTAELKTDGYTLLDGPRWTGDGYYESTFLDPDGNRVEITL
jgi:lactoylglutathione lyase